MTRLYAVLAAIGAALVGVLTYGASKQRKGAQEATEAAEDIDNTRSKEIERKADAARSNDSDLSPVERVRKHDRLRD